jgi:hypothetical protein
MAQLWLDSTVAGTEHPQVTTSPDLDSVPDRLRHHERSTRFADRVGEGEKVVVGRPRLRGIDGQSDDLPAARGTQAFGVRLAQVVGVGLGIRRKRAKHRLLVAVHVGQSRIGGPRTRVARAMPSGSHVSDRTGTALDALGLRPCRYRGGRFLEPRVTAHCDTRGELAGRPSELIRAADQPSRLR